MEQTRRVPSSNWLARDTRPLLSTSLLTTPRPTCTEYSMSEGEILRKAYNMRSYQICSPSFLEGL
ncbi:Uncharacterized protein FKW44_021465 [Caligus rogercresseyi]|uniref:Uncharacterized protein n=1 Tax=Caligus rogercresseyi TaxID=217165 RepID=A0A7T8JWF3_CALRO|nr:Uncharacterized protein FKW44_021465 [Caligus rogercresseyi]